MNWILPACVLALSACSQQPDEAFGCQQSGARGKEPTPADASCAAQQFIGEFRTWDAERLAAAVPSQDAGRTDVLLATLRDSAYRLTPTQRSAGTGAAWSINVHRVDAWPLINGQGFAAAAARLGSAATSAAVTAEKNRYATAQINAGLVPYADLQVPITFVWSEERGQWTVDVTRALLTGLLQR